MFSPSFAIDSNCNEFDYDDEIDEELMKVNEEVQQFKILNSRKTSEEFALDGCEDDDNNEVYEDHYQDFFCFMLKLQNMKNNPEIYQEMLDLNKENSDEIDEIPKEETDNFKMLEEESKEIEAL